MRNVVIIGGGASGMMAALSAAENKDNRVTVLERQARPGRKLMSTGNGRCNLTNTGADENGYHGEDGEFVCPALEAFPPDVALDYFRVLGLLTVEEYGGRVYPLSNSANSVVDVLRFAMDAAGVDFHGSRRAMAIKRRGDRFAVETETEPLDAERVIVACGGLAGEKLGGVKDGYELLCSLGHSRTALRPALVQITTDPLYPRALKGVKADAALSLEKNGIITAQSSGELLFTDSGVSGPAAFELSRAVSTAGDVKLLLHINFFRETRSFILNSLLCRRRELMPELPAGELLTGMLHNRLGRMVVKAAGINGQAPIRELGARELDSVVRLCKDFPLTVKGTEGFASAQVTAGGVRTAEFDPNTMGSRLVPGLYACGEVLDVDGDCGGYNLQWAWASGRLAGRLL